MCVLESHHHRALDPLLEEARPVRMTSVFGVHMRKCDSLLNASQLAFDSIEFVVEHLVNLHRLLVDRPLDRLTNIRTKKHNRHRQYGAQSNHDWVSDVTGAYLS